MSKKIFILSAGKLEGDHSHSLKSKHKRRAQRVGHTLSCIIHELDCVTSSSDPAAIETCLKALKAGSFDLSKHKIVDNPLEQLNELNDNISNILIVMTHDQIHSQMKSLWKSSLRKGTLLCLQYPQNWEIFKWSYCEIKNLIDPEQLPSSFPFITEKGIEQRSRPAYYYQQSAALPYRNNNNEKEVMLITSRSGKWGLPKGIVDPALTPHLSAAKEAEEEAGVKGHIFDTPVGEYTINKWGAEIPVSVFPLQVQNIIDQDGWKESNRERKWCSLEEAKSLIQVQEINQLLDHIYALT